MESGTFTVTSNEVDEPAGNGLFWKSGLVHVTSAPAAEQLQPPSLALTKLVPAGSVSSTVIVPR